MNQINQRIIESNQPDHEYYFPPNKEQDTKTKSEILLGEALQYSIEQSPSLLFRLFDLNRILSLYYYSIS